jgi:hypothetical protein
LDHDPTHDDIREFFTAFRNALRVRGLALRGVTTDGSPLYPGPIAAIFPGVRHQVCEFHAIAEITKAVLHAVSKVRKQLAAKKTPLGVAVLAPRRPSERHGEMTGCKRRSATCLNIGICLLPTT